ncbi:MAG TPA: FAD-binding oxidoreductase [Streptosporangiaceae bacterium]|jgi:alkyldihydroxyacetonephosphate synthase
MTKHTAGVSPSGERAADMPWAGWSEPLALPDGARALLQAFLGTDLTPSAATAEADVALPTSRLPAAAAAAFAGAIGPGHVNSGRPSRLGHTGGKSTPDLLRRRRGDAAAAPDAVLTPGSHDEVLAVLDAASMHHVAVVPFGGGTSVTGGVEALRGQFGAVIALDLRRLNRLVNLDAESLTATLQAGLRGPQAEALLAAHGLTLGHLPQSFEHATIGGFAATRSAGQASAGYGRFDDMVLAIRAATPRGTVDAGGRAPASAAGPDLRQLLLGSEGTFGVITEVTVRVRRQPAAVLDEAWSFPDFGSGMTALRTLTQTGEGTPDIVRLNDPTDTAIVTLGQNRARTGAPEITGCLAITSYEGTAAGTAARRAAAAAVFGQHGGYSLGPEPVATWRAGRFSAPRLRDTLLDVGVFVETLETAASWAALPALHAAVPAALTASLTAAGTPPVVSCHISHVYPSGASLYYTVIAGQAADPLAAWAAAKAAAADAIMEQGGTITHHHAVGTDHRAWMHAEIGDLGVAVLRAVKAALDPVGVLNPGKLIPPQSEAP